MVRSSPHKLPPFSPTTGALRFFKLSTCGLNSFVTIKPFSQEKSPAPFLCDHRTGKGELLTQYCL